MDVARLVQRAENVMLRGWLRSIWMIPGATLVIVAAALVWFAYADYVDTLEQEFRVLQSNDRIAGAQVTGLVRTLERLLDRIALTQKYLPLDRRAGVDAELTREARLYPEIRSLIVTNAQGRITFTNRPALNGFDASQRDYFIAHRAQPLQPNFYVSRPYMIAVGDDTSIAFSVAMYDAAGRFQGVVAAVVNPQFFASVLTRVLPEGEGALAMLFNARGDVVYQVPGPQTKQTLTPRNAPAVWQQEWTAAPRTRHIGRFFLDDGTRMVAINRLGTSGLGVAVSNQYAPVLGAWRRDVALRVFIFLLASAVALGLTWQVRRREIALDRVNAELTADIAARLQAEASLKLYASVFEHSNEATLIADRGNHIVAVNAAFTRCTGYAIADVQGKNPRMLASGQTAVETYQALWLGLVSNDYWQGELWDRRKDGSVYPKWMSIAVVRNPQGDITHYVANSMDITERKYGELALQNLADALHESRQRLRDLAAETQERLETERKRIARDVHDELGQVLAVLRMNMSLVRMRWGAGDVELSERMVAMKALVDRAIVSVRNVATHLRPMVLDAGVVPAIEWLCGEFTTNTKIACVFDAEHPDITLDETLGVVVFRIVQEALTNITRHANASTVRVSIAWRGSDLWVEVRDNGQGFDPAQAQQGRSFGLLGMRERALAINGRIDIVSSPSQGTVVVLTIPINMKTKDSA